MTTRYGSLTLQLKALANLADIGSAYTDTLVSASGSQELSKVGRGSFTVSIRAYALLTAVSSNIGQVAYVYITDAVASSAAMDVAAFIIKDIDKDTGGMVTVSGPDILHQLTYTTLDANVIDDGAGGVDTTDIDSIMAYAASGWANTGGNTTNGTYYASNGNNVLEALIAAAKQNGEMFRLSAMSPPSKTVHWLNSADSSGITLRLPATPITYDASTTTGIILSMSENNSQSQVVTRIKPHGAGLSDGRLNIRDIDAGDTGGDPAGYTTTFNTSPANTITNTALETALGYMIKQDVDFSHIRAEDPSNATQLTTAAVALWNEGINFLQERDSSNKVYDVECVVPYDLRPGQTVTIVYTEYEGGTSGGNAVWTINAAFTIHRVTNRVGNSGDTSGVRVTSLTVGESHVARPSGESQMVAAARTARETTRKADPTTGPGSVTQARSVQTAEPLEGGGDFSADRTHSLGTLNSYGSANQVLGANAAADDIEYKTVTAGTGISVGHTAGTITITNTDTGSGLSGLAYVTIGNTASLSAERALTAGAGLTLADGGANGAATIATATADTSMTINADSIQVRLAATSGLAISTGLMIADTIAGAGLTIASKVLAVGAGDGIDVAADAVAVDVTDFVGDGLVEVATNNIALGTPGTLTAASTNAVATSSHTHAITSSSNPGAAASILATDASGVLTLEQLQLLNEKYIVFGNAAASAAAGSIRADSSDNLAILGGTAGKIIYFSPRNIADSAYLQAQFSDAGGGEIQLYFLGNGHVTAGADLNLTPTAGNDLLVNLSTTGDFIVNTSQLVVDTSAGRVGIGIASSLSAKLHIDQESTTAAIPPILIDQADLSEEMIAFQTTVGAGNAMDSSAPVGTYWGKVRITINGVDKFMAIYNS